MIRKNSLKFVLHGCQIGCQNISYRHDVTMHNRKISKSAKGRDMSTVQKKGTEAAKKSPKAGKFETNSSAKRWVLLSLDKEVYGCRNLAEFVRKNLELFDIQPTDKEVLRVCHGFFTIKKNLIRKVGTITYKGWTLLNWSDEININR